MHDALNVAISASMACHGPATTIAQRASACIVEIQTERIRRACRLAARDATGSGGRTPLRSTGPSDTIARDDPTTVALTTALSGSPTLPSERRSQ